VYLHFVFNLGADGPDGQRHASTSYSNLGGRQGRSGLPRNISPLPGSDPRTFHLVANRYTDYAFSGHPGM
jgi:hypothetical protein